MDAEAQCPYLVHVTNDWLCLYPRGVFCRHPDGRIRIPGAVTLADRCVGDGFRECEGYVRSAGEGGHDGA
jgi:hypothetical protein